MAANVSMLRRSLSFTRRVVGRGLAVIGCALSLSVLRPPELDPVTNKRFRFDFGTVATIGGGYLFLKSRNERNRREMEEIKANPARKFVLEVPLDSLVESKTAASSIAGDWLGLPSGTSLWELQRALQHAKEDKRVVGVVGTLKRGVRLEVASVQELQSLLNDFKSSGKETWAHAYNVMSSKDYLALSAFKSVALQPSGYAYLPVLTANDFFYKRLFQFLGIQAQFIKRAEYKNAPNVFTEDSYTGPHLESRLSLLKGLQDEIVSGIATNRKLTAEQVASLQQTALFTDTEALEMKLVDHIALRNQLEYSIESGKFVLTPIDKPMLPTTQPPMVERSNLERIVALIKETTSSGPSPPKEGEAALTRAELVQKLATEPAVYPVSISNYLRSNPAPTTTDIAVIYASGPIQSSDGIQNSRNVSITDSQMAKDFDKVRRMSSVKAVVLHVNSPGGQADASEAIWSEVRKTQAAGKKVIVSMGDYAASGGYYIAAPADAIMAQPATVTGSIGIFFGKFHIRELLSKLHIDLGILSAARGPEQVTHVEQPVQQGEPIVAASASDPEQELRHEFLLSPLHQWTEAERKFLDRVLEKSYDHFKARVGQGRKMTPEQVEQVAKGRVWTGRQAQKVGLVDQLGGVPEAIDLARRMINNPAANANLVSAMTSRDVVRSLLQSSAEMAAVLQKAAHFSTEVEMAAEARHPTISAEMTPVDYR